VLCEEVLDTGFISCLPRMTGISDAIARSVEEVSGLLIIAPDTPLLDFMGDTVRGEGEGEGEGEGRCDGEFVSVRECLCVMDMSLCKAGEREEDEEGLTGDRETGTDGFLSLIFPLLPAL